MDSSGTFQIDSISPMFKYSPSFPGTDPNIGWAYGVDGQNVQGIISAGQSWYYTRAPNAEAQISVYASSINIYGKSTCQTRLFADGSSTPLTNNGGSQSPGLILSTDKLTPNQQHDLTLQVNCPNTSASFDFGYARVDGWLGKTGIVPVYRVVDDQDTSLFNYSGNWTSNTNLESGSYNNDSQHYSSSAGDTVTLTFPDEAIALYGSLQPDHGTNTVQIDSGPITKLQTFNTTTAKRIFSSLIFFQGGLGTGKNKTITIKNLGPGYLDLDSVTFFNSSNILSNPSDSKGHISKGIIYGIAAAVVLLALISVSIVFFCLVRRRKKKRVLKELNSELRLLTPYADDSPHSTPWSLSSDPATSHLHPTPFILPNTSHESQTLLAVPSAYPQSHTSPSRPSTPPPDYTIASQDIPVPSGASSSSSSPQPPQPAHTSTTSPKGAAFPRVQPAVPPTTQTAFTTTTGSSLSASDREREQRTSSAMSSASADYVSAPRRRDEKPDPNFMYPNL